MSVQWAQIGTNTTIGGNGLSSSLGMHTSIQIPLPLETDLKVVSPKNEWNRGTFTP